LILFTNYLVYQKEISSVRITITCR